jgi:hypothetical protein
MPFGNVVAIAAGKLKSRLKILVGPHHAVNADSTGTAAMETQNVATRHHYTVAGSA